VRILFLSTWWPDPPNNGSKLRVYHLLRALNDRHEVSLISFAFDSGSTEGTQALQAICRSCQVVALNPFVINRASTLGTFLSASPAASRPVAAMSQVAAAAYEQTAFDVVIASTEMMACYALAAPAGAVKALEEHNSLTRWMAERYRQQRNPLQQARCWTSWQKQRAHERRTLPSFDLVTMVSEEDRRATAENGRRGKPKIEVVPNGVDCMHNQVGLAQSRPNALVFNGALTYAANYDAMQWFLAQVYPSLREQASGVSLTITGSTQEVDRAALVLDPTVRFTGYVADVRLPVAEAAVCVAPIRQGGGTRLKILEAMALGTPVVSTRKGAEGLEVVDGEHLLIADDATAFASHVLALLQTPALRARLSTNARRLVEERYDWKQIGDRFVSLVEEVATRRGRAL
jgi:polysaccharide biosynthesis protein PslH